MNIIRFVKKLQGNLRDTSAILELSQKSTQIKVEENLAAIRSELRKQIPHSPILQGYSVYSQNDEDGILEEIFKRINVSNPNFFEFGVAPEENNTNYLLLKGSKGCWIDKGLSEFKELIGQNNTLKVFDEFVRLDNIAPILQQGCQFIHIPTNGIDLISLDLDGNDYYFIEKIIQSGIFPKVFSLEYNAVFPPPLHTRIEYSDNNLWQGDDYFGCSLMAYCDLLSPYYTLVSCNIPGSNCFFVRNELNAPFTAYPVRDLYQPPRYYHSPFIKGHPPSSKFVLDRIRRQG
jgi:hypothetical protein